MNGTVGFTRQIKHLKKRIGYLFPFPLHTGTDGAGMVVQVGPGVSKVKIGDRILFQGWTDNKRSSFQEYTVVDVDLCAKIPDTLSFLEAAALPLPLITAAFGLALPYPAQPTPSAAAKDFKFPPRGGAGLTPFWRTEAKGSCAGQAILILGGSSSVGQLAIQIAHHLGFSDIVTTASITNAEHLTSLGATTVLDRSTTFDPNPNLPKNLNIIFDTVSCATQSHIHHLAPGGKLISIGTISPELGSMGVSTYGSAHYYSEYGKELFGAVEGLLNEGVLRPLGVEKLGGGLGSVPDGLGRLQRGEAGGMRGRLVVDPSETGMRKDE
ncbi:hypothetical protein VNI00_000436 [Paramarasmius palmivorus]|uniref:Enoyl reductase (ER) domain-containing protein n=1 Tax=Paramarasmius palmivorus TaxID=297713 RepID=A0AAW0E5R7_9AGAR